ncbi:MAG: hypothetical protein SVO96_04655 [Pseudomonadota bacterium]|nr:hypothetical protein [Pseudomonadota bacterium]
MQIPLELTYRNLDGSPAIEERAVSASRSSNGSRPTSWPAAS